MTEMLYATFNDPDMAEKAVGAMLDHGVEKDAISLIASEKWVEKRKGEGHTEAVDPVSMAKDGISTTTAADAASGAATGAGIGLGVGALVAVASLIIPGFGLVTGGGALATAIGAALGTAAGGAIAGGVTGFLKDQGMPESRAAQYEAELLKGGALIAVALPSGEMNQVGVRQILSKYNATNFSSYAATM